MSALWVNSWWKHLRQQLKLWVCWDRSLPTLHTLIEQYLPIHLNKTVQAHSSCVGSVDGQQSSSHATDFRLDLGRGSDWATEGRLSLRSLSYSSVTVAVCFMSLSYWKMNFRPNFCFLAESSRFSSRIFLYFDPSIFPSILTSAPVPDDEKHRHNMMLPPPCITVGMVFFGWCAVLGLCQK